jgi:hypothetical protein
MAPRLRHRRPKGAETVEREPTATAPHLDSTTSCAPALAGFPPPRVRHRSRLITQATTHEGARKRRTALALSWSSLSPSAGDSANYLRLHPCHRRDRRPRVRFHSTSSTIIDRFGVNLRIHAVSSWLQGPMLVPTMPCGATRLVAARLFSSCAPQLQGCLALTRCRRTRQSLLALAKRRQVQLIGSAHPHSEVLQRLHRVPSRGRPQAEESNMHCHAL